ncbi:hypothetical protein [Malaciobacter marinus]|jgi:uncharacterized protein YktB (UPF0637 family)|uniref:Uncharacterized protein n=1 Tax=Malaciobacter marinus TaxID=505249 RepID=A0AB37A114_9BACT|nr:MULTISPECIES: hypothetical protein [Malaciobacter]PPK62432.1 hypothetical protein B0F89_10324 [Malaciobacter marinus]RYA24746.1 hypothetical protein CRU96_01055 [Malaciobacter halophilus]SKB25155.1 hypothetical protein SAMN06295997_101146 [Malaciobacter marinus]
MFNISLALVGQVARTAAFGAIATKVVDTFILSKVNNKIDQKRWIRQAKLEAFAKLSQEILSIDLKNLKDENIRNIKEYSAKTILLLEDRILIKRIEDYLNNLINLDKTTHDSSKNMVCIVDKKGIDLVMCLNKNLKKV